MKNTNSKTQSDSPVAKPTLEHIEPIVTKNGVVDDTDYSLRTAELDFDNEVYDEGDIASALEMSFIAQALEAHKSKVAPETHPDFDGETCIDCGDDIPQIRLDMGRIRCVHCQETLEKKKKMRG